LAYGDIVAIRQYVRRGIASTGSAGPSGKESLIAKLRAKLMDTDGNMEKRKLTMKDNKYAKKDKRRIELGWLHCESDTVARQVRPAKGGGTRHLMVSSDTTVADVMQSALEMYFPHGESQKGRLEDFTFSMVNFDHSDILLTDTISLLYDRKRVKMLRLYLRSQYQACSIAQGKEPIDEPNTQAELICTGMYIDSHSLFWHFVRLHCWWGAGIASVGI